MRTVEPDKWYSKVRKRPPLWDSSLEQNTSLEMRLRASWWDTTTEFWNNSSVRIQTRVADTTLSKLERRLHGALLAVCFFWAVHVMYDRWMVEVRNAPAQVVTRQATERSITQVPFPAVALCSNNVIARSALDNYIDYLRSRSNSSLPWDKIRKNFLQFGLLLTMEQPQLDVAFTQFLARLDLNFNVTNLMATVSAAFKSFSSPCEAMLKRCSWRGSLLPCNQLFASRVTPLGFCCVFNSRYHNIDLKRPPKYLDMVGNSYGLTAVVHEKPEDFAQTRRASVGVDVLLFDGSEYPLVEGGGVRMYPLEQNTSVFLSLRATSQQPSGAVAGCERRQRQAWCLTECRRRTLAALCGCRHHTLPLDPADRMGTCSLIDLPCLNKHREKLIYYYPHGYSTPALEEELQNGQVCSECEPDCARLLYSASTRVSRYVHGHLHKYFKRSIVDGTPLVNVTILRVFYATDHQDVYSVDRSKIWYETFASLSSIWCGVTATTMITLSEVIFYYSLRWAHHFRRRTQRVRRRPSTYHT